MIQKCFIENRGSPKSIYPYRIDLKWKKRDVSYIIYHIEISLFTKTCVADMSQNLGHFV